MENPDRAWTRNKDGSAPDSDLDGQAIDIFVFSNGQQYSPPRKYHLQSDDIHLWKSTLNHLAKTQYGPLYSSVDLYTTEGIQVQDPIHLSDMGSYVAVQPRDNFIFAGYDKYLVKASRSWERRNSKKDESALELGKGNVEDIAEKSTSIMKSRDHRDASVDAKNIESYMPNQDGSTIIRPQLLPTPQTTSLMPLIPQEKKKTSIQSPFLNRKITPSSSPTPLRNSFKKKDSLKMSNNVKITRPECNRQSSKSFSGLTGANLGKSVPKYGVNQTPIKPKQLIRSNAVLPKVQEVINEMRTSSTVKLIVANEQRSSNNSSDLRNIIEEKSLLETSNFYEIPPRELPSLDANPIQSIICAPMRQDGNISVTSELSSKRYSENGAQHINKLNGKIKIDVSGQDILESINVHNSIVNNSAREKMSAEKLLDEQYLHHELSQKSEDPVNFTNGIKISLPSIVLYPNMSTTDKNKTQDSPIRKSSVMVAKELQDEFKIAKVIENSGTSRIVISTSKSSETIKVYNRNSSPPRSSIMNKVIDNQFITLNTINDSASATTDKLFDNQLKATLKKGDVVNFKLNIEIENHNGGLTEQKDDLKTESVTMTVRGSQSNLDDQFITENKSLLTLVTKKLNEHNIGDNHRIIIIQCNNCKYCDHNVGSAYKASKKDFVIMLPNEKFEEISERCHCNDTDPENVEPNTDYPVGIACSCSSIQRMSKVCSLQLPEGTGAQNECVTQNPKNNDEILTVVRKKSVAISKESTIPNSREHSTIFQEVDVKSEPIAVSVESIGTGHTVAMIDKSTQTDWCDVLLEATLLSDGHYTFRLPSLDIVKRYKFM